MIEIDKTNRECTFKFHCTKVQKIFLCGDFNNWDEKSHPMKKVGDLWQLSLRLPAGEYRFKYLVDDFWYNDLEAHKYTPNVWGSDDSVVVVPEPTVTVAPPD
jgi:1,4-alpha-glucan branching enzyme